MTAAIAERLRAAAAALPEGAVPLRRLAQAHGPAATGSWLLLLAVPCLLPVPGVGTLLGVGLAAIAATMWRGETTTGLPDRVAEVEMPSRWARRVLRLLASMHAVAGRFAKERWSTLAMPGRRSVTAATVALMAVVIVLPIPLGNVLPALATVLLGLGLVFRDGLVATLGFATAGLALVYTAGVVAMVWTWSAGWVGA